MQDGKHRCVPVILNNFVRIMWGQVMPCLGRKTTYELCVSHAALLL